MPTLCPLASPCRAEADLFAFPRVWFGPVFFNGASLAFLILAETSVLPEERGATIRPRVVVCLL